MAALTLTSITHARAELDKALKIASAALGIDFKLGNIRYNAESFRCTLNATVRGAAGLPTTTAVAPEMLSLMRSGIYNLPATFKVTDTYKSVRLGRVKFVGFNSRAFKYPYIVSTASGKRYKVNRESARGMVEAGAV
jgi:hypothetical protein